MAWRDGRPEIDERVTAGLLAGALAALSLLALVGLNTPPAAPVRLPAPPPAFSLNLSEDGASLRLAGPIDPGITAALEAVLIATPGVRTLVLESNGGRIAEGRGLIRLVREHGLATRVEGECLSACALVFVAGAERSLGRSGRLGFHSFALRGRAPVRLIDVAAEQSRDLDRLIAQGIAPGFVARIAATPPAEMWYPSRAELRAAGILPRVPAR